MTGGLLQLISAGTQDILLTRNPEFTFFKMVYHRYTNFSKFNNTIIFENKVLFNTINRVNIPKNGDLLDNMYVSVNLPELNVIYERELYEEVNNQIDDIKIVTQNEKNNLLLTYNNIINHINKQQYYQSFTNFDDKTNSTLANAMTGGVINTNNLITKNLTTNTNVDTFYQLTENLLNKYLPDSQIFTDFGHDDTFELSKTDNINKSDFDLIDSDYYIDMLLNVFYNNNISSLLNYLNYKKQSYLMNTPNRYIEKLFMEVLFYFTSNNYNLLSYYLLSSNTSLKKENKTDSEFDTLNILQCNLIEIKYNNSNIYTSNKASSYDIIFISNLETFNLKNIVSILEKQKLSSLYNEDVLYKLKENDTTNFPDGLFCFSNYLNITGWSGNKNIYTKTSISLKANSNDVYQIELNDITNLENDQILFGFNNNTSTINTNPDFIFYIQNITPNNNTIEGIIFDNKLNGYNIDKVVINTNDYNNHEKTYLSNGFISITPVDYEIFFSDIWNNFKFINSSTNNTIISLSQSNFYNNVIKYSKSCISIQKQILSNLINVLFTDAITISITFNVNQSTQEVDNYYETNLYSTYDNFIKKFLYKDSSYLLCYNTNSEDTPEFIYNKFLNRVLNYLINSDNNIKSEYTSYGNIFFNGLSLASNLLSLNNIIKYYTDTSPYITIILNGASYSDGATVAIGNIVYLYNSNTVNSSNLIGIFKILEMDTTDVAKPRVKLAYNDYNKDITGLELSISKIDSITDNAYLFHDNTETKSIQIDGNILDETKYVIKIVDDNNNYVSYSSDPSGTDTSNKIEVDKYFWIYSSSSSNFYSSSANFLGKAKLSVINPDNNDSSSTREYIFYIDSSEDPNINFDTNSFTYFGFCQNEDNTSASFDKGFRINTITVTDRYFSTNAINNITTNDNEYRGYKFTNILYLYYLSYLYDQLKTTTTSFNKLLLGRLFLIGSKIHQLISLNSNFTSAPEQLINTIKLSYYSDFSKIFNSNTILNEFLLKETANISTHYSLLRAYMNDKSFTRIVNNEDIVTTYSYDGANLNKTESNSTNVTVVPDDDLLGDIKTYFSNKLNELSDSAYVDIVAEQTIDSNLYYISSNDYLCEIYINIINNIYYDDLIDKKSREIGILFYDYVNDSNSINDTIIRNIIENEILVYDSIHVLSGKDNYIDLLNIRYNKTGVTTSYEVLFDNYLYHEDIINKVANIDFYENLSLSDTDIKNNIYTKVGLAEGDSTGLTTSVNKIFVQDETDKSVYSFIERSIQDNNEVYDFLHKFTFIVSLYQIYNKLSSYLRSWQINQIINTNDITLDKINTLLENNSLEQYVELSYENIAGNTKTIYVPLSLESIITEKVSYILSLSADDRLIEANIGVKEESGLYDKIKEYYFTTGSSYKSVKLLETELNGTGGFFDGSGFKIIRGCIVTDTEYTNLNYNILEVLVKEVNDYGGIKSMIVPFDIDNIFCSTIDATSQTTLSLENSNLRIQSNNHPEPGANTLNITEKTFDYKINIRAGLNEKYHTEMKAGDIGISINGVILRNVYSLTSPAGTTNVPNSVYNITVYHDSYFDYDNNSITTKVLDVGDTLKLYSNGIVENSSYIGEVTITSVTNNIITFNSQYNESIKSDIYGFLKDEVTTNALSNYGVKFVNVVSESFRLNLLSYFTEFTDREDNYHSAIDSDNSFNYYSGKFMSALSGITNSYLDTSNFSGDKLRHTDGHSKILGISYDGYPIYGPFGYKKPLEVGDIKLIQSSYNIKSEFTTNRNDIITVAGGVVTAFDSGTIIEDYEYIEGIGDLDECNGRYCITPEFPQGTYAYFLTFDNETDMNPVYPYIIGNKFYSENSIASNSQISNVNITLNNNLGDYSINDTVNFIGSNGKYGKGIIKSSDNNLKYVEITDDGIKYSANIKINMFKEIPSTLEYIDEQKLFLRRKSRLYDGYYFDIGNDEISINKPVDITDQTKFSESLEKINNIMLDLKNLLIDNTIPALDITSLYDTTKYENILNIIGVENLVMNLASLSPDFFGDNLKSILYNEINLSSYNFKDVINNYISSLFSKYKNEYKLYYTENIYIERDYTISSLNLESYIKNTINTSFDEEIKSLLNSEISLLNTNYTNYTQYKTDITSVLSRETTPKFSWINNLGNFIFNSVELYFNDLLIDKIYSDWNNIWYELNCDYDKKELMERMIGATKDLITIDSTIKNSKKLILPLNFWFSRYKGLNIPLVAMPYVNIFLKFEIESLENLVRKDIGTKVELGSELNMEIISNYIYLDETERKLFAEARHEYLIEQIQFNGIQNVDSLNPRFTVYFRNNIKDIYWILLNNNNLYDKNKGNYSLNNDDNSGNPITSTKILLNNVKLVELDGTYTNYVIPYERYSSTPSDGVNVYGFNLNNFIYQPSGSLNFSMLDKVEMQMEINNNLSTNSNMKILVFANSYNILRIMSGLAGLAFIE